MNQEIKANTCNKLTSANRRALSPSSNDPNKHSLKDASASSKAAHVANFHKDDKAKINKLD